ncbi:uncharacterized protein LOC126809912 [Patella vulgata]|uniref:uncharacterized protein LOC126809912 n=1 Tax=Patella vulgata TaxID=6465 RepID=UPI0024A8F041|nr:uncharacterized protein LOC126809912 [Patella vulgata]
MGEAPEKCFVELRRLSNSTVSKRCCSCPIKSIENESKKLYKKRIKSDTDESVDMVKTKRKLLVRSREISEVDENDIDSSVFEFDTNAVNVSPRKRLQYQRSLSLPDVVTSSSPIFKDFSESPDVVKRKERQTFFSESSESMDKASCLKRKKMYIEGPVVFSRSKSVTFKNKTEVCLSDQGIQARKSYVRGPSSGYGTGSEQSVSTCSNTSLSTDMPHSLEQKSDDENDCPKLKGQQIEEKCAKGNSTEEGWDSKIPMISILQQNSNGSICLNLDIANKLLQYGDRKNPASISDLNTISPLSQFCNEQLEEEMCKKKTQPSPQTFTRIPLQKEERFLKNELYKFHFESEMLNSNKNPCDFIFPDMTTPSPRYNDLKPGSGTDTCSRCGIFNYMPTRCSQSYEPQTADMFGYGTNAFEYDSKCVDSIERACRCTDTRCKDISCNMMKNLLDGLKKVLCEYRTTLDPNHQKILFALRCHSERCNEIKCKMPWCEILCSIEDWSISKAITEIRNRESSLLDSKSSYKECVKISRDCQKRYRNKSMIKEGEDWYYLMHINKKTNLLLAKELHETTGNNWIIKKTSLNDYDQQLGVYMKLRECNSPYIVQHHWVVEHGNSLLICNEFKHSGSLKEILIESKAEYREIISWMCQVIAGVLHLHKYDIIFLKWASKNILIGDNNRLQICDLSCSVLTKLRQAEYDEVKRSLPLTICPPEMMESVPNITEKSDIWGCGCLLYELCTTYPVFNELRHDKPEEVWEKIFNSKMPSLPRIFRNYQHILDKCWVSKVNQRASLNDIQDLFVHASRKFQQERAEY